MRVGQSEVVLFGGGALTCRTCCSEPFAVLHYPSEREFLREIKSRTYDYIGISFVVATFHKLRRMAHLIRRHSPRSRIVLGRYGKVLPDHELAPFGDSLCREEGSGFIIIDEDFFIHAKRASEFLGCVREGGRPLSIMGFGSVRGLSQFTGKEIAEMGFDILWTAFEGNWIGI